LLPAIGAADEVASPADLAVLASREQQLRAQVDDRLNAWVAAVTEDERQDLTVRTTALQREQALRVARQDDSAPPAKRARVDGSATTRLQGAGNTACTRVGHTLECVLRDHTSR
jgi:hypothetical protein